MAKHESIETILLKGSTFTFILRKNSRAKRTSLTVYPDGRLVATIPERATVGAAERLIRAEQRWILRQLEKIGKREMIQFPRLSKKEIGEYKRKARVFIEERLRSFNSIYSFSYKRVTVRSQKTMWGSCSYNRNLSFNFRLVFLPEHLAEYIIAHELCHVKEHNHSDTFWKLVKETIPDYKKCNRELRKYVLT